MQEVGRDFFKKYHRAVVKAVGSDTEKVKARIGSQWAEEFRERAGTISGEDEFASAFQDYLQNELRFCEGVKVNRDGDSLELEVRGCHICHGNEELRREGQPTLCPIVPTGLFSISRVAGRKAALQEVRKQGVVGECEIIYKVADRGGGRGR